MIHGRCSFDGIYLYIPVDAQRNPLGMPTVHEAASSSNCIWLKHGHIDLEIQRHRRQMSIQTEINVDGPEFRLDADIAPQLFNLIEELSELVRCAVAHSCDWLGFLTAAL